MKDFVIGIDQGTTGTYVGLMDSQGDIVRHAYRAHEQIHPRPDHVEHDPEEIWTNVCLLLNQVIEAAPAGAERIAGIGIANQGESVVLWDAHTGHALSNIIVWQDTRTQASMDAAAADAAVSAEIRDRTGLRPDAYFSASKMRWLLEHTPGLDALRAAGRLRCGTLDSWLISKMTGQTRSLTDPSTASRTLLFNIHTLAWDDWLLEFFRIPREVLADVTESTGDCGVTNHPDIAARGLPILTSVVDQPAAMIGQGCLAPGTIKATYGTGCFINLNTGRKAILSEHGLLTLLAWQRDGLPTYGLDGGVFSAGASVNWLHDEAGLISAPAEIDALCGAVPDSGGVIWIPAQVGLGAPYWNRKIRGAWLGVGLATERAHLVRAVLEGIALRVAQIVGAMRLDSGMEITRLRVDGGLTRSAGMMQIQADALGVPVEVLEDDEATARGVCSLTARRAGIWTSDEEIVRRVRVARVFEPPMTAEAREARLAAFDQAVRTLIHWHDENT